ncbi:hypothetical protein PNOK_0668600 [Pyrrhoderma noxium]|uniref:Uncharacterized protein n=1 Tax=Pyrrhoderma noxium TaxID=2282107 RepID=A0A286UF35_9AGAM|nr:hypothetical protein PNOK_0668600 [Pyrrhoderma noxium]
MSPVLRPSLYLGLERVPEVKLLLSAERILSFNNPSHVHQDNSTDDHTAYKGGGNDSLSMGNVHVPGDLGVSSTSFSAKTRSFVIPKRTITLTSLYPDESILELNEGWVYVSPWHTALLEFDFSVMNLTVSLPGKTGQSSTVENYKLRKCAVAAYFPTLDGLIASNRLLTIEGPASMKLISQLYLLEGSEVFTGLTWSKWAAWKNESHSQADPGKLGIAHGIQSTTDMFSCSELLKGTLLASA